MSNEKTTFALTGRLIWKGEIKHVSEKFSVLEFVIEVEGGQWSSFPKFQLANDRCALIEKYTTGAMLKVEFDVQGRKWSKNGEDQYFNSLNAWRLTCLDAQPAPTEDKMYGKADDVPSAPQAAPAPVTDDTDEIFGNNDPLPF